MTADEARQLAPGDRVTFSSDPQYVFTGTVESVGGYDHTCVNIQWDDGTYGSVHTADMENFTAAAAS
jgi:hypothetical protein